ncbi:hypothetical protein Hdeb2414_s0005g00171361 [Helianthus debilis subsp. tardiflorus]
MHLATNVLSLSLSLRLADDWPSTLLIDRLVSQDHMNSKYDPHISAHIVCTVVRLPSQTLLLSVTDKPFRLIGMLFPGVS